MWLLSEGVEVISEATITSCSYSRSQRKVMLGLSNGQSVGISHLAFSLRITLSNVYSRPTTSYALVAHVTVPSAAVMIFMLHGL